MVKKLSEKKSQNAEKTERGTLWDFQHPFCVPNIKKNEGGTLWGKKFSEKKVSQCRKKIESGGSMVSPGMICYAGKQEKTFWFSSLGQMEQFDTIVFGRTLRTTLVSSCGLKKKRKKSHYNSRVSLQEAPAKSPAVSTRVYATPGFC